MKSTGAFDTTRRIRVLFLALQAPDRAPSQRYRFEAFQPFLEANGVEVEYAWTLSADDLHTFYGKEPLLSKARVATAALARRLGSLVRGVSGRRPDVVFVQREAFFLGGAWAEQWAARLAPIVFDFDDAIWIKIVSEGNRRFGFLKNVEKIPEIIRLAHTVLAGNEYLASYARLHSERVKVVPTCVDTQRYVPVQQRRDGPVVIGWSGSPGTVSHLRLILPALERLRARYGDRVHFKVVGDPTFRHEPLGIVGERWQSDEEVAALQAMNIGLMPLPDDEWSKGKCGLKGLTYMAVGIPAVISPVGANSELFLDGVTGFAPRTEDEWVARLGQLVEDSELRQRMGEAARSRVVAHYSIERWRESVLQVFQEAARAKG